MKGNDFIKYDSARGAVNEFRSNSEIIKRAFKL